MLQVSILKRLKGFDLDVNFNLPEESGAIALFGPSGTGKSLTLQVIAGLVQPDAGMITLGEDILLDTARRINLPARKRQIGFVPQNYTLFPHLNVRKNILFGVPHLSPGLREERLARLLKLMRLENLERRLPSQLSGGQQQRVALARALITEPRLLLLDEPFAALDSVIRGRLQEELLNIQERFRVPVILVTHDLSEAYTLSQQMVVLDHGRVVQSGPRDEVLFQPATEAVARFTGTRNIFSGRVVEIDPEGCFVTVESNQIRTQTAWPDFPVNTGEQIDFCIRPERILFTVQGRSRDRGAAGNYLAARITREIAHGTSYTIYLSLETPLYKTTRDTSYDIQVEVSAEVYRRLEVQNQKNWLLALPREHVHLIPPQSRA
ncbi:MAG TPA: ABC transporter ATP-binding protein [Chloroflexia bacterium]|nr:ABC transporter ATP-binding protein [Chloroflexia bacterium]